MHTFDFGKFKIFKAKAISFNVLEPVETITCLFFEPIFLNRGTFVISDDEILKFLKFYQIYQHFRHQKQ